MGIARSTYYDQPPIRIDDTVLVETMSDVSDNFEPVACTLASGWEKGQIENQVGNIREWLFTPTPRFADFEALNAWLATRCRELGARQHPTMDMTIADVFASEQPLLRPVTMPFDAYIEQPLRVSSTCLVSVDRNRYSVPAEWVGKVVSVRIIADTIRVVAGGELVARHQRQFGRNQLICEPWHYLSILETKPGALRHGLPFINWKLPTADLHDDNAGCAGAALGTSRQLRPI
jgi:hypothetical protein